MGRARQPLFLFEAPLARFGEVRHAHKADVVAAVRVLVARVAQADDEFHGGLRIIRKAGLRQTPQRHCRQARTLSKFLALHYNILNCDILREYHRQIVDWAIIKDYTL